MLAEPRWFYDAPTRTAVIYMVNVSSTDALSLTGVGTVQMELVNTSYQVFTRDPFVGDSPFTVGYVPDDDEDNNADYSAAWRNYIVRSLGWTEVSPNKYQVPTDATTLVVKEYDVVVHSV